LLGGDCAGGKRCVWEINVSPDCHDKTEILLKMALNTITLIFAGRTTLRIYI
jgi:hypothetical protein